jgi:predicted RNase H-like HicB family nuclease
MKEYPVIVTREGAWYVALNPDTGVASQGASVENALENLEEALSLYLEETDDEPESTGPSLLTTVKV